MVGKKKRQLVPRPFTQAEKVLIAIFNASSGSIQKVPYEDIVLNAWKEFPDDFSLRNHPEHPDASDVHKRIYQTLAPNGLVVSLGHKIFRLTEKGVEAASHLTAGASVEKKPGVRLSRQEELLIRNALGTRAFAVWKDNRSEDLVDYDVRLFFQFGASTSPGERRRRAKSAIEAITHAKTARVPEASALSDLAEFLLKKFPTSFQ